MILALSIHVSVLQVTDGAHVFQPAGAAHLQEQENPQTEAPHRHTERGGLRYRVNVNFESSSDIYLM